MEIPDGAIYRINLAWVNTIDELKDLLLKHQEHKIFLDLPIGRTKPPHNNYSLEEIIPILQLHNNIKYFAVSNVDSKNDLTKYSEIIPTNIIIVPKIESPDGILNIKEITDALSSKEKVIMLDHDDLFSKLTKQNESPSTFKNYITDLTNFCAENNIILLRTLGVIFGDAEKRLTQYAG
jgi:citrate lyase beta subunit